VTTQGKKLDRRVRVCLLDGAHLAIAVERGDRVVSVRAEEGEAIDIRPTFDPVVTSATE
jgi:hypothetical protein